MPNFSRFGSKRGGDRTPHSTTPVASPATNIKTPYWASTEVNPSAISTTPSATHTIPRKPVGAGASSGTPTTQSTSSSAKSIPRKPVPTSPSTQPAWKYVPVEGNPSRPSPRRDSQQYGLVYAQPEALQQPAIESKRRTYSPPHWASEEDINNLHQPEVAAGCYARLEAHNAAQEIERPLSPGSIFANGGQAVRERKPSTASKVFSRGIGSVRRAAGQAAYQAKRKLSVAQEPKISAPVPGSFQRGGGGGHVLEAQEGLAPLELVGLGVAQGHVSRYGQADYKLVDAQAVEARALALSMLTGETLSAQPASVTPAPAARRPPVRPPRPASPAPAPPAAPLATKPKAPRMVLGNGSQETVFTDFVNAANDPSWIKEAQADAPYEGKGKGRAEPILPVPHNPFSPAQGGSSRNLAPKPLSIRKKPVVPWDDKSLPPTPPEQLPTRHNTFASTFANTSKPFTATSLSAALAAEGVHRTSYVPGIKCADCGRKIDAFAVADHRCGKKAAQAADNEAQPTGRSREDVYAANFGNLSLDDKPQVVVDTFLREGHTSWKGLVRSKSGGSSESLGGKLGGGAEGVRRSNEADGSSAEGKDGRHKKISGHG